MSVGEEGSAAAGDLALVTLEGVRVESVPAAFAEEHGIAAGDLIKFFIDGATEETEEGEEEGDGAVLAMDGAAESGQLPPPPPPPEQQLQPQQVSSLSSLSSLSSAPSSAAPFSSAAATAFAAAASFGSSRDDAPLLPRGAALVNPRFVKKCSPNRALADSWSKILFQCRARSGVVQPTINEILAASQPPHASAPPPPPPPPPHAPAAAGVGVGASASGAATAGDGDEELADAA